MFQTGYDNSSPAPQEIFIKIYQTFVCILLTNANGNAIINFQVARLERLCAIDSNVLFVQSYYICWARRMNVVHP